MDTPPIEGGTIMCMSTKATLETGNLITPGINFEACAGCATEVIISPSGQQLMADHPGKWRLLCEVCTIDNIVQKLQTDPEFKGFEPISEAQEAEMRSVGLSDEEIDKAKRSMEYINDLMKRFKPAG